MRGSRRCCDINHAASKQVGFGGVAFLLEMCEGVNESRIPKYINIKDC